MIIRALLAALILLAACGPQPQTSKSDVRIPTVATDDHGELAERADRGRQRPLQPPAVPDAHTIAAARPAPQRTVKPPTRAVLSPSPAQWARLRQCESGGNYQANTGNGFYGAFQADRGTWAGYGGYRIASDAPASVQDQWAQALYARRGAQPWPVCGRWLR